MSSKLDQDAPSLDQVPVTTRADEALATVRRVLHEGKWPEVHGYVCHPSLCKPNEGKPADHNP